MEVAHDNDQVSKISEKYLSSARTAQHRTAKMATLKKQVIVLAKIVKKKNYGAGAKGYKSHCKTIVIRCVRISRYISKFVVFSTVSADMANWSFTAITTRTFPYKFYKSSRTSLRIITVILIQYLIYLVL